MNPETDAVFDAALALPEADRALLVEQLLESLSPDGAELTDDELSDELDLRRAEIQKGIVKPIQWSDALLDD
jgi:putative addiction module component (TIGR02574 family)